MVLEFGKFGLKKLKSLIFINVHITDKYSWNKISGWNRRIQMSNHWDLLEKIFISVNHVPIYFLVVTTECSSTFLWWDNRRIFCYLSFFFQMAYSQCWNDLSSLKYLLQYQCCDHYKYFCQNKKLSFSIFLKFKNGCFKQQIPVAASDLVNLFEKQFLFGR